MKTVVPVVLVLALAVVAFFGGGLVLAPKPIDPIAAFCRGFTTGNAAAYVQFTGLNRDGYEAAKAKIEASCVERITNDPDVALAYLDGPLGIEYERDEKGIIVTTTTTVRAPERSDPGTTGSTVAP